MSENKDNMAENTKFKNRMIVISILAVIALGVVWVMDGYKIIPKPFGTIIITIIAVSLGLYSYLTAYALAKKAPVRVKQNKIGHIFTILGILIPLSSFVVIIMFRNIEPEEIHKYLPVLYIILGIMIVILIGSFLYSNVFRKVELEIEKGATKKEIEDVKKGFEKGRSAGVVFFIAFLVLYLLFRYVIKF